MFEEIDPALRAWVGRQRLHLAARFRDDAVRAVPLVDDSGGEYEIWVIMAERDPVTVHASDPRTRAHWFRGGALPEVSSLLDGALAEVDGWIRRAGRTRSVY